MTATTAESPRREYHRSWYEKNRRKVVEKADAWNRANPEKVKSWRRDYLLRQKGSSAAEYDAALHAQGGHCGACPRTDGLVAHVDGGSLQGVLCRSCRTSIAKTKHGLYKPNIRRYLERRGA